MLHIPEFSVNDQVSYWNGKTFFKCHVRGLFLNPLSNIVEYKLFHRTSNSSKGVMKFTAKPNEIKQSKHFRK